LQTQSIPSITTTNLLKLRRFKKTFKVFIAAVPGVLPSATAAGFALLQTTNSDLEGNE
jgi:hypothetical protein